MILNAFTQYQTSFRAKDKGEKSTFSGLQNVVYGWVKEKEKDRLIKNDVKSFFKRCDWKNLYNTRSSIGTNTYFCDDYRAWGFRYAEPDRELGPKRYWYTDIGLKDINNEVIFYARVSYAKSQHDLSAINEVPDTSVPRFIRYILRGDYSIYSQKPAFGLFDQPVPVEKVGKGKMIADLITSAERRYPLIVMNGGGEPVMEEAISLAYNLAGKCQVIYLGDNPELAEEFRHYLPKELWVSYGRLRVYFPINIRNLRPERHRWYDINDPEYRIHRKGIINGLLRNNTLEEDGCIQNISDIGRQITLGKLHAFKEQNPDKQAEVDEVYELVTEIEKERDDYKQQADFFASEHESLESEVHALRNRFEAMSAYSATNENEKRKLEFLESFNALPNDLIGVIECFKTLRANTLNFTKEAIKEAADYKQFTEIATAWAMLSHISTTLYDIKFNNPNGGDFEKLFKEQSGYELAMSEGRQTKRNARLMDMRKVVHNGVEYDITPHLKWGNKEPKMLRIHFAFDEDARKIIVGYVGPHMENSISRGRK